MTVVLPFFPTGNFDIDFGVNNEINFTVLENVFGDGYIQRAADGLNSNRNTWSATWTNLTDAESDLVFGFLKARAGYQPFYYQAPGDSDFKQWTARDVKRKPAGVSDNKAYWTITATLKEEFGSTIEILSIQMLTGVEATGSGGNITGNSPIITLFGVAGLGVIGRISISHAALQGVAATGSAGNILGSITKLVGVSATGIAGTVT